MSQRLLQLNQIILSLKLLRWYLLKDHDVGDKDDDDGEDDDNGKYYYDGHDDVNDKIIDNSKTSS